MRPGRYFTCYVEWLSLLSFTDTDFFDRLLRMTGVDFRSWEMALCRGF